MISKAVIKYTRFSPRKARTVIALVKGKNAKHALGILESANNKASGLLSRLVKSAIANAKRFPNTNEDDLYISDIYADGGPSLKRFRAEPMGRASVLRKPTCHITVVLDIKQTKAKPQVKKTVRRKLKKVETEQNNKERKKNKADKKAVSSKH